MADDGFAELHKLKQRLEALGVKIKKGHVDGFEAVPTQGVRESLEQAAVRQSKEEVGRLMNRCWAVDAAVSPRAPDPGVRESAQQEAAQYYEALEDADPVDPEDCPRDSPEHSRGAQGRQMVLHTNSKPARSASPASKKAPKRGKAAFVSTVRQSAAPGTTGTPLAALLADYKDAEKRWNHEKAGLRRELAGERKRANKLESNFDKLNAMYESRLVDVRALRTALQNRDQQVRAANARAQDLDDTLLQANNCAAEEMAGIARERDDLKALLVATLKRLETVDRVVQRADVANAMLEERIADSEAARHDAAEAARSAESRVQALLQSQRKVEWQNKLLDRISEVQMSHNRQKTAAIQELLERPGGQESTHGGTTVAGDPDDDLGTVADDYTETMASDMDGTSASLYEMHNRLRQARPH